MNIKMIVSLSALAVCGVAYPGTVYVAPELPEGSDGSGSSWANATTDIAAACATAAAQEGGGEVWLKTGVYYTPTTIPMYSNLKVIGGFAGDETAFAEADPVANPTILTHDSNASARWRFDGTGGQTLGGAIRTGMIINPPPADSMGYGRYLKIYAGDFVKPTCFKDSTGSLVNVRFSGIIFCTLTLEAIVVGNGSQVKIDHCRFVACNSKSRSGSAINSTGALDVSDTEFLGCTFAVIDSPSAADAVSRYTRCTFDTCTQPSDLNGSATIAYASAVNKRTLFLKSCMFKNCGSTGSYNTTTDSKMEDCRIESCFGGMYAFNLNIERCVFRGNQLLAGTIGQASIVAPVNANGEKMLIRDTLFEGNRVTGSVVSTATKHAYFASAIAIKENSNHPVVCNCTFISNVNEAVSTGWCLAGTIACSLDSSNPRTRSLSLANCTFEDNRASADLSFAMTAATSSFISANTVVSINTIFHSHDSAYVPFIVPEGVTPGLANCNVFNYDVTSFSTGGNGFVYDVTTENPKLGKLVAGDNGAWAIGLESDSPVRKSGRPVWQDSEGNFWFYDSNLRTPWRDLRSIETKAASVAGLTQESDPIEDAFGASRNVKRIACGPLNAPPLGLMLIFR